MRKPAIYIVLAGLSLGFSQVEAQTTGLSFRIQEADEGFCWLITFEGGAHQNRIHSQTGGLVPGTPIRFEDTWFTITSGPYANNPSVPTIAIFTGTHTAVVDFDAPVDRVSQFYASSSSVTLEAYDVHGGLIASVVGPANLQPDGFNQWDPLVVDAGTDAITRLTVTGTSGGTGIDDFVACQRSVELIEVEIDLHPGNYPNGVDPYHTNSNRPVELGVISTTDFDATTIEISTAMLRDPTLNGFVLARNSRTSDINMDGVDDLIIDFGIAHDFDAAAALTSDSTEVELFALTVDENVFVLGHDTVVVR